MRTIDYSTLMYRWMQLAGLDRSAITSINFNTFRDFASNRIEHIWKNDYWPDLIRVSSPQTVSVDGNGVRTVALPSDCGELLDIYDQDPRLTTRARSLKYFLYSSATTDYANLMQDTTPVYLEYKVKAPSSTKAPAGNFYNCIVDTTAGQSPKTTSSSWSKVEIPYFTGDFLIRACLADYLRSESQFDQALVVENDATAALEREVDKVIREQGQVRRASVFTY
ncbi:MAG: hypothetical protein RIR91_719 [Verrucomicrobiota bacterium]